MRIGVVNAIVTVLVGALVVAMLTFGVQATLTHFDLTQRSEYVAPMIAISLILISILFVFMEGILWLPLSWRWFRGLIDPTAALEGVWIQKTDYDDRRYTASVVFYCHESRVFKYYGYGFKDYADRNSDVWAWDCHVFQYFPRQSRVFFRSFGMGGQGAGGRDDPDEDRRSYGELKPTGPGLDRLDGNVLECPPRSEGTPQWRSIRTMARVKPGKVRRSIKKDIPDSESDFRKVLADHHAIVEPPTA